MSRYIEITNDIKSHASVEWLTPSQSEVFEEVSRLLQRQFVVNVHGPAGVGKTFLGWIASRELSFEYLPHPRCLVNLAPVQRAEGVIVDHVSEGRQDFRDLLKETQLRGYHRLVLLSPGSVQDTLPTLELGCTEEDSRLVLARLLPQSPSDIPKEPPYLWQIVWHCIHQAFAPDGIIGLNHLSSSGSGNGGDT